MATINLGPVAVPTSGDLPAVGTTAPDFALVGADFSDINLGSFAGRKVVLNIVPSVDTGVCAISARTFNERAAAAPNTTIVNISIDLPPALKRFCAAEGIENVVMSSGFRSDFGERYGVKMLEGKLAGFYARAVVVLDTDGTVLYTEQVPQIGQEPDYDAALAALG